MPKKFDPNLPVEAHKSSLYGRLSKEYKLGVQDVQKKVAKMLEVVDKNCFYHYTAHDINHAQRTLGAFCEILGKLGRLEDLSEDDAAASICACLVHDIGMGPITDIEKEGLFQKRINENVIKKWREDHHERTLQWVMLDDVFAFLDGSPGAREMVGQIARGHRKIPLLTDIFFVAKPMVRFLAAVLKLADQMDLSPERIKDRLNVNDPIESVKRFLETSQSEEEKKQLLEVLKNLPNKKWSLVQKEGDYRTLLLEPEVKFDPPVALPVLAAIEELFGDIELTLEQIKDVDSGFPRYVKVSPLIPKAVCDHRLRANYDNVWEYLSRLLYPPKLRGEIPIREAVANALDACTVLEEDAKPEVVVKDLGTRVIVEDNGIGLSRSDIEDYLMELGSSYYQSVRFKGWLGARGRDRPSLIARFGIGAFSYLMVSGGYEMQTCTQSGESHRIVFSEHFGIVEEGKMKERGTKVTIPCASGTRPSQWSDSKELYGVLRRLYVRPRVPIYFEASDGTRYEVGKFDTTRQPVKDAMFNVDRLERKQVKSSRIKHAVRFDAHVFASVVYNKSSPPNVYDYRVFRTNESTYGAETSPERARFGYRILYSGMNIPNSSRFVAPYLFSLHAALLPYRVPETDYHNISLKPEADYEAWLDFNPQDIEIGLTKNYFEEEYADAIRMAVQELNSLCVDTLKLMLTSENTPWQIKDRIRCSFLVSRTLQLSEEEEPGIELSKAEWHYRLKSDDTRSSAFHEIMGEDQNMRKLMLDDLYCIDLKKDQLITMNSLLSLERDEEINIVNLNFTPSSWFNQFRWKQLIRAIMTGMMRKKSRAQRLLHVIKKPRIILSLNSGEIVPLIMGAYLEDNGFTSVRYLSGTEPTFLYDAVFLRDIDYKLSAS